MNIFVLLSFFLLTLFLSFIFVRMFLKKRDYIFFNLFLLLLVPSFEVGSYAASMYSEEIVVLGNMLMYVFLSIVFFRVNGGEK